MKRKVQQQEVDLVMDGGRRHLFGLNITLKFTSFNDNVEISPHICFVLIVFVVRLIC